MKSIFLNYFLDSYIPVVHDPKSCEQRKVTGSKKILLVAVFDTFERYWYVPVISLRGIFVANVIEVQNQPTLLSGKQSAFADVPVGRKNLAKKQKNPYFPNLIMKKKLR
jgi:hypothetical protein